jgi:hypothetical protein
MSNCILHLGEYKNTITFRGLQIKWQNNDNRIFLHNLYWALKRQIVLSVNQVLRLLHRADVGDVADVLEVQWLYVQYPTGLFLYVILNSVQWLSVAVGFL